MLIFRKNLKLLKSSNGDLKDVFASNLFVCSLCTVGNFILKCRRSVFFVLESDSDSNFFMF